MSAASVAADRPHQLRRYTRTAMVFHWLVAVLVIATIPVGGTMAELERGPTQDAMFIFHKNVGVLLFLLVSARLIWRLMNPPPPLPASVPDWQRVASQAVHGALYALLFIMTISGYVYVKAGGFPIESLDALGVPPLVPQNKVLSDSAKYIHSLARIALIALVLLHIGAALHHQFVRKDGLIRRMWPR
jgi:cytochrome b561